MLSRQSIHSAACKSGQCTCGKCTGLSKRVPNGARCSDWFDCESGYCKNGDSYTSIGCAGRCVPKLSTGGDCSKVSLQNLCYSSSGFVADRFIQTTYRTLWIYTRPTLQNFLRQEMIRHANQTTVSVGAVPTRPMCSPITPDAAKTGRFLAVDAHPTQFASIPILTHFFPSDCESGWCEGMASAACNGICKPKRKAGEKCYGGYDASCESGKCSGLTVSSLCCYYLLL